MSVDHYENFRSNRSAFRRIFDGMSRDLLLRSRTDAFADDGNAPRT